MRESVLILCRNERETILYAAEELKRYLSLAGVSAWTSVRETHSPYIKILELAVTPEEFWGKEGQCLERSPHSSQRDTAESPSHSVRQNAAETPPRSVRRNVDAYAITVTDLGGSIKGSNNRSVLLGAYRYLKELGFAFLRPDREGERIPASVGPHTVNIREEASSRYRGICIEGAVSFENIMRFVTWLPKAGFNTYFTQFKIPYEFFKTWYLHTNNPYYEKEPVPSEEEVDAFVKEILVPHIKKLGLIWQAGGHGFTTGAAGLPGTGWDPMAEEKVPEERREYLAMIDGKRGLFHGVPLNTSLCCSNPLVRELLVREILHYIHGNPRLDMVHVWLADDGNNSCECGACAAKRPSDWYIEILNQVDEVLSKEGSPVKVVFLAYYDLLWPPVSAKLLNPERFVFMFAPITRSYRTPLPVEETPLIPPYKRNQCRFPVNAGENMHYCSAWKQFFRGDSFLYDYHYMWNQFRDWGDYGSAEILWKDLVNLEEAGFDGYVSCQQTRVFAPTGFGMYVMAETLWNRSCTFEMLARKYFRMVYGDQAEVVLSYCKELSALSYMEQPENDDPGVCAEAVEKLKAAADLIRTYRPFFEKNFGDEKIQDRMAWKYLLYSGRAAEMYISMLKYRRLGAEDRVSEEYRKLKEYLCRTEEEWQEGFDVYWFVKDRDKKFLASDT